MFDTFEGFNKKDISESEKKISNPQNTEFKDTSVELVLSKMANKDKNIQIFPICDIEGSAIITK